MKTLVARIQDVIDDVNSLPNYDTREQLRDLAGIAMIQQITLDRLVATVKRLIAASDTLILTEL